MAGPLRSCLPEPTWLLGVLENDLIHSVFQPIIDLFTQNLFGYEILSRGVVPFENPSVMFQIARDEGMLWDLERVCRQKALNTIASFRGQIPDIRFFLNVSPDVLSDHRFTGGFTQNLLSQYGIDRSSIVIEITEDGESPDHQRLENVVRHYSSQGFQIALDDFGCGHSSLKTLVSVNPHFLKLDKLFVRNVDQDPYKQHLIKAVVSFASGVESRLIAEGVETWEELETLMRLGVRYVQGFLIGYPCSRPEAIPESIVTRIAQLCQRFFYSDSSADESISRLIQRIDTVSSMNISCAETDRLFKQKPQLDHIVILNEQQPIGLITRLHFYLKTGGPFGYPLFQRKKLSELIKHDALIVNETIPATRLARLAMDRLPDDVYDPVIVVGPGNRYVGTVSIRYLLSRAIELEIKTALSANPLTNLPGNVMLQRWLEEYTRRETFTIIYADLDHFKEFNDVFGFVRGDDLIKFTAIQLQKMLIERNSDSHLAHIGGDDFVIISGGSISPSTLDSICSEFDRMKMDFFPSDVLKAGVFESHNRMGEHVKVPITTLSLAVMTRENFQTAPPVAFISQVAALLKKTVKSITNQTLQSGWFAERRMYR